MSSSARSTRRRQDPPGRQAAAARRPDPTRYERHQYDDALQIVALWWSAGPHKPGTRMPAGIRDAYRIVGRFAGRHYAPRHGVPHPQKSTRDRLKRSNLEAQHLPPGFSIVTKTIRSKSRSWSTAYLEHVHAGVITRYRRGLRHHTISIRGLSPGLGSAARNPCNWRPLSKKELSTLHPAVLAFLDAFAGR